MCFFLMVYDPKTSYNKKLYFQNFTCYIEPDTLFNSWKKIKTRIPPLKEVNTPCNIIIGFANLIKNSTIFFYYK